MWKEIIISIVIIVSIFTGNITTHNYTKNSIQNITEDLEGIRNEMKEEQAQEKIESHMNEIDNKWSNMYEKMAYYIEHDELEKVETNLVAMRSFIETEEYPDAISELDKSIFVLKHIKDKNTLEFKNIF